MTVADRYKSCTSKWTDCSKIKINLHLVYKSQVPSVTTPIFLNYSCIGVVEHCFPDSLLNYSDNIGYNFNDYLTHWLQTQLKSWNNIASNVIYSVAFRNFLSNEYINRAWTLYEWKIKIACDWVIKSKCYAKKTQSISWSLTTAPPDNSRQVKVWVIYGEPSQATAVEMSYLNSRGLTRECYVTLQFRVKAYGGRWPWRRL
jgi:hypothetical protein